jgi:hypothetical protein
VGKLLASLGLTAILVFSSPDSYGQEAAPGQNHSPSTPAPTGFSPDEHVRHIRAHRKLKPKPKPDVAENKEASKAIGKNPEVSALQSKVITDETSIVSARHAKPARGVSQAQKIKKKIVVPKKKLSQPTPPAAVTIEPKSHGFFEELFGDN